MRPSLEEGRGFKVELTAVTQLTSVLSKIRYTRGNSV